MDTSDDLRNRSNGIRMPRSGICLPQGLPRSKDVRMVAGLLPLLDVRDVAETLALGLLVRWLYLIDEYAETAGHTLLSEGLVEDVLHVRGVVRVMRVIGWADYDEEALVVMPNAADYFKTTARRRRQLAECAARIRRLKAAELRRGYPPSER